MTQSLTRHMADLGLALPGTAAPVANYLPYVVIGNLVFLSGQICQRDGVPAYVGRLGAEISVEDGVKAAELCALNLLAWLGRVVEDDLARVARCVRLGGFVRSAEGFSRQPLVVNGASDLLVRVLGERGRHARTAVGVSELPAGVAVEIDAIFALL